MFSKIKKDLLGGVFAASAITVAGTASADMVALLLPENVNPRWAVSYTHLTLPTISDV